MNVTAAFGDSASCANAGAIEFEDDPGVVLADLSVDGIQCVVQIRVPAGSRGGVVAEYEQRSIHCNNYGKFLPRIHMPKLPIGVHAGPGHID